MKLRKNRPSTVLSKKATALGKSAEKLKRKKKTSSILQFSEPPLTFVSQFFANLLSEDLADLSPATRKKIVTSVWQLAQKRPKGATLLRLYNPDKVENGWTLDHSILEIITDDRPFLLDSIVGCLQSHGFAVHLSIHPVLSMRRDEAGRLIEIDGDQSAPESLMHIHFDRCLDKKIFETLEADLRDVLALVCAVVDDRARMRLKTGEMVAAILTTGTKQHASDDIEETKAFIDWLNSKNFTYLGYMFLKLQSKSARPQWNTVAGSGLGILRGEPHGLFGDLLENADSNQRLDAFLDSTRPIMIIKADQNSRVHRTVPMDAIFVQKTDEEGNIVGHHLLIGLFTSVAYAQSSGDVPFIRKKIEAITTRAHFDPQGHNGRALMHILDSYPRDELFQIDEDALFANTLAIVQLQDRPRVALFMRRDLFGRFTTCLVFVPRERYDAHVGARIQAVLEDAIGGKQTDQSVRIGNSPLARLFITIKTRNEARPTDKAEIEARLQVVCKAFPDTLRECMLTNVGEVETLRLLRKYDGAFPADYMASMAGPEALADILAIETSPRDGKLYVHAAAPGADGLVTIKLFKKETPLVLSDIFPSIENMGLGIKTAMGPYAITPKSTDSAGTIYLHRLVCKTRQMPCEPFSTLAPLFEMALRAVLEGDAENDLFNALTLAAGLSWREINVLRSFARYLHQLRIPYSHEMMAAAMLAHPSLAAQLVALFRVRHDPDLKDDRTHQMNAIMHLIQQGLANVTAIEDDRIIRRYLNLIESSLRTNYFQKTPDGRSKDYLALKFDSRAISFMPLPKPLREVFVTSPRVEAIHLRGGKVARGGIRWSDRRDDFRNEILGLMKAQMVKNTVIVPVGSKGGFIVKKPPEDSDKLQAEGIACYETLMRGLLDVTDNRVGKRIVPPPRVVRHDGDDPYLVVAADKGTATFSDIANKQSQTYGFWLDDAFASGGSAGYDHKQMGITARGAWEAIKRHFRERGTNIQTTDFTCIGVGDMSGDVFGNAMLLSKHIRLLAAFDHRHIFCDPNADAATGYAERKRLFALPRSSWNDYDRSKLSKGGQIFSRGDKTLTLTPEIKKAFGISADQLTPAELIQTLLSADIDLLYFGGIGTYVAASFETEEQVKDRNNDALRIIATNLRAKVIGEGANLALTQNARIEFALSGGRINTDAIDNSAGVSTSDHEVNIKILLRKLTMDGTLTLGARNKLLASMTDDVAALVLRDNYLQTEALSLAERTAPSLLPLHATAMHALERSGLLNRKIEFLPDEATLDERAKRAQGLTRPELAVLMAYTKLWFYDQLLSAPLLDDPYLKTGLLAYFPPKLQSKYPDQIAAHQLRHEILATMLTNDIVNRLGSANLFDLMDRTGAAPADIAKAYVLARDAYDLPAFWNEIEQQDNKLSTATQYKLLSDIRQVLLTVMAGLLSRPSGGQKMGQMIRDDREGVRKIAMWLSGSKSQHFCDDNAQTTLTELGVAAPLAKRLSLLPSLAAGPVISNLSLLTNRPFETTALTYFNMGTRLNYAWIAAKTEQISDAGKRWRQEALNVMLAQLDKSRQKIVTAALTAKTKDPKATPMTLWEKAHQNELQRYDDFMAEMKTAGSFDFAMFTLILRYLDQLAAPAS